MAADCLEQTKASALVLVPPYVEEIGQSVELLESLLQR